MQRYFASLVIGEVQIKLASQPNEWLLKKKNKPALKITSVDEDMEKLKPLCTTDGNLKLCRWNGK